MVNRKEQKYIYWTDKVVEEVQQRVKQNKVLQKIVKERGYIVYDEKTPSGKIHIGSGRGWVIHDIIAKSFRDHGLKGRFILSSDDIDPMDSIPPDLPKERFEKFLGIPLRNIPSPEKGYESFADYYFSQCTELFDKWGIEAELESTGERYIKGDFNRMIKIALDNADKIQNIYKKIYGKTIGAEKLPFNPICEKCGKIGTTLAYEWNGDEEIVKYSCEPNLVEWAKGCGHKGEISPYNGNGKLPWKVEWAAKWPTVGVVVETAGKDHFTKGGSRTIAVAISCEVFNYPPPWPSTCNNEGEGYEFFLVEGKKMSTSKGIGVSFAEISQLVPPEILRFLMVKTRPQTTVDFKEENIPLIYNELERYERIYYDLEKVDERERANAKRIYELAVIGEIPKEKPFRPPFEKLIELVKILPDNNQLEFAINKLKEWNQITVVTDKIKKDVEEKLAFAKSWYEDFGKVSEIKIELTDGEKNIINELIDIIKEEYDGENLQTKIFNLINKHNSDPKKIFKKLYQILLKTDSGPRLGPYIIERGKEEVIQKLKAVL
ncbi:MAG: lysine--tRNA ligase [Candidatus Aenigmatarchaeota archaeon]